MKRKKTNPRIVAIVLLAIVAGGLLICMVVLAPRRSNFGLESGKYRMTVAVRAANEEKAQEIDSEVDMTVKNDGGILIVNPARPRSRLAARLKTTSSRLR